MNNNITFKLDWLAKIKEDLLTVKGPGLRQKIWAYRRGFLSSRIDLFDLNEDNHRQYLSDLDYLRMHYNDSQQYNVWIDNKLTIKYVLSPFDHCLPRYYFHLTSQGKLAAVHRLMDCPEGCEASVTGIITLLEEREALAAKLIFGMRGIGFYKLSGSKNKYFINQQPVNKNELTSFLQKLNGYIVTEYLFSHRELMEISGNSPSSIRITALHAEGTEPLIAGAYMKFGTQQAGMIDNMHAGAVAANVDLESGRFSRGMTDRKHVLYEVKVHPDTEKEIEGTVPFWGQIKATIIAICIYIPQVRIMGFDIIITNEGFKIIEINSRPAIGLHNYYSPFYADEKRREVFQRLLEIDEK